MALTGTAETRNEPEGPAPDLAAFVHALAFDDLSPSVRRHARRSLMDLLGVAAAGSRTPNGVLLRDHAAAHSGPGAHGARLLFDGRRVSVPGAAMAGAASIDALDAHDGHRLTRGHAGVVVLPALLAVTDEMAPASGPEFLTRFVLGYEVAVRAGIALHASAPSYFTSGAWNALGAAALAARALRLDAEGTRQALGAAEFHSPRGLMMRCIDFPTMVKDGAGPGAHAGVSAALLAAGGFTAPPASVLDDGGDTGAWADLGSLWRMEEQYMKPWPVCRWAQPAIEAAAQVRDTIAGRPVVRVVVETFYEATRLTVARPVTTEAAQYSLPFPLAAMLLHGRVDAGTVTEGLGDDAVLALADKVELTVSRTLNSAFPARRAARLVVILADGGVVETGAVEARGEPETPLSDADLVTKFVDLSGPVIGRARALAIAEKVASLERLPDVKPLLDLVLAPPGNA